MIVDAHHHYADESHYTEYRDFPARLIEAMDRYGWDRVCLSGVGAAFHNRGNGDVAEAVARFPDRLVGLGYVDLDVRKPGYVDEVACMGMRGLKIIATHKRYDDDAYLPFYERAAANGLPILFHTGFLGGDISSTPHDACSDNYRPIMLDRIARLFPDLPLIAAHMGTGTWFHEALAVMSHPNVYGDTSGGPSERSPEFFLTPPNDRLNWNKVIFGSDSLPNDGHIPFGKLKRLMAGLGLDQATRRGVLGETAARIFGLTDNRETGTNGPSDSYDRRRVVLHG